MSYADRIEEENPPGSKKEGVGKRKKAYRDPISSEPGNPGSSH
jgi:hypothetical protein